MKTDKVWEYIEATILKIASGRVKVGQLGSIEIWAHSSLIATGLCIFAFLLYECLKQGYGLEYDLFYLSVWVFLAISILAHEIGHVVMAKVLGCGKAALAFHALGGIAFFDRESLSAKPWKLLLVCASGPLANLGLACLSWWCMDYMSKDGQLLLEIFGEMNLILLVNLLPLYPLDGGRIFKAFMEIVGISQKIAWKSTICCSCIGYLGLLWFWVTISEWLGVAELVILAPLLSWITWADFRSGAS
jgi:stage IV sporulation protein FB